MVENCSIITPRDISRILRREDKTKMDSKGLDIDCWLDDPNDSDIICLSVKGNEPQRIVLEWVDLNFGREAFFKCDCGQRCSKLYSPPNSTQYKCRKCHKLKYRISSLNPKSKAGQMLHRFNRINKLIEERANMSRIFYRGQYTRRFNIFLTSCKEVGLNDIVENAQNLLDIVKVQ